MKTVNLEHYIGVTQDVLVPAPDNSTVKLIFGKSNRPFPGTKYEYVCVPTGLPNQYKITLDGMTDLDLTEGDYRYGTVSKDSVGNIKLIQHGKIYIVSTLTRFAE